MAEDGTLDPREADEKPGSPDDPATQGEWVLPPEARSRRHFLRTAVISTAAAAAVVGGGAVLATTPIGPKLLGTIAPAKAGTSPNTCIDIVQGSKNPGGNPNMVLQFPCPQDNGDFAVGCILKIVSASQPSQTQTVTVTAVDPCVSGTFDVHITPGLAKEYPAHSCCYVL